ncbi:MAG TPA: hypothetical protein VLH77_00180, partial [Gammaproteobacteria bacterium]|nr:hypothetical protein [Gammaproteobacteria bacterium]
MSAAGRSDPKTDKPRKLIFIDLETIASANRLEGESEFKNLEGGLRTMGRVVGRALSQPELDELINSRRSQPDDFVLVRRNGDDGNSVCPDGAKVVRQLWKLHQLGYTLVSGSSQNDENEQAAILEALQIQASQYNREHQLTETDDDYLQVPPFEKARGNVTTADKQELRKQVTSHFNVTPSTEHIVIDKSIYVLLKARGEGYSAYPAITANDRIPNARPLTDILYTIIAQNQTSELKTEVKSEAKKEAAPVLTAEEKEANAFVETELDQRKNLLTPESSPSDHLPRKVGSDMIIYNIMTQYGTENDEATSGYVVADDKTGAPTAETPDQYRNRLLNRIAPLLVQMAQKNSSVDFLVLQEAPRVSDEKSLGQEFLNGVLDKLGREWDVESQKDVPLSKCTFYRKTKYTVDKSASFSLQRQISFKCNLLLLPQEQPTAREIEQAQTMHRPLLYKKGADF